MNDQNRTTQLALFESQFPNWKSLPREAQQCILDVLSQLLMDALVRRCSDPITTTPITTEDNDVS